MYICRYVGIESLTAYSENPLDGQTILFRIFSCIINERTFMTLFFCSSAHILHTYTRRVNGVLCARADVYILKYFNKHRTTLSILI